MYTKFMDGKILKAFKLHSVFCITLIYLLVINIIYIINLNKKRKILTNFYPKWWYTIIWVIF